MSTLQAGRHNWPPARQQLVPCFCRKPKWGRAPSLQLCHGALAVWSPPFSCLNCDSAWAYRTQRRTLGARCATPYSTGIRTTQPYALQVGKGTSGTMLYGISFTTGRRALACSLSARRCLSVQKTLLWPDAAPQTCTCLASGALLPQLISPSRPLSGWRASRRPVKRPRLRRQLMPKPKLNICRRPERALSRVFAFSPWLWNAQGHGIRLQPRSCDASVPEQFSAAGPSWAPALMPRRPQPACSTRPDPLPAFFGLRLDLSRAARPRPSAWVSQAAVSSPPLIGCTGLSSILHFLASAWVSQAALPSPPPLGCVKLCRILLPPFAWLTRRLSVERVSVCKCLAAFGFLGFVPPSYAVVGLFCRVAGS